MRKALIAVSTVAFALSAFATIETASAAEKLSIKKSILLLVANGEGELRFVALGVQ